MQVRGGDSASEERVGSAWRIIAEYACVTITTASSAFNWARPGQPVPRNHGRRPGWTRSGSTSYTPGTTWHARSHAAGSARPESSPWPTSQPFRVWWTTGTCRRNERLPTTTWSGIARSKTSHPRRKLARTRYALTKSSYAISRLARRCAPNTSSCTEASQRQCAPARARSSVHPYSNR
jgi:hypothetical protein